ncbi:MAG: hypothetical protein MR872_02840 [Clostridium sp.]|nr:hypothetical protein [Clostridium sp.]
MVPPEFAGKSILPAAFHAVTLHRRRRLYGKPQISAPFACALKGDNSSPSLTALHHAAAL